MPTVLAAWQLGAGLGHLMQLLPLARGLVGAGHPVFVALRDLYRAGAVYGRTGVSFLQAPSKVSGKLYFRPTMTFSHLIANMGFGEDTELFALASAWRNIFRLVRPDVIVFDHSPAALLAARGLPARRLLIGSGFCCPPDVYPLPLIRPEDAATVDPAQIAADEDKLLKRVNWMLAHWKQPPLDRLGQLYGEVDETFLVTFGELDHYGQRPGVRYWGPVNATGGKPPEWPTEGTGSRIAAYVKRFPALPALLDVLNRRGHPTLVFADGLPRTLREKYQSPTLRFETQRLDPAAVARECDIAILNATHGTTCDMLLAGKPILQLPLVAEQRLTARRVEQLGAGLTVSQREKDADKIEQGLDKVISEASYAAAARAFAARHADFEPQTQRPEMLERVCELLPAAPAARQLETQSVQVPVERTPAITPWEGVAGRPRAFS